MKRCDKCGSNNANTHVKTIINGELREYDLCAECAHKLGYGSPFADFDSEFSSLLGSFFGNALPARTQATRCEFCGSTYNEIAKTGHVGCANCYTVFAGELYPSIRRMHGNTVHCGKRSEAERESKASAPEKTAPTREEKLASLKKELEQAVSEQRYERAAELRDQIKGMEA